VLGIIEYHRPWDQRVLKDGWARLMKEYMSSHGVTFIARSSLGEPLGFMSGFVSRSNGVFEEMFAYMDNAYVEAGARAQGVGTAMLKRFEEWSIDQGATDLRLDVVAGNEIGSAFWAKSGFQVRRFEMSKPLEAP
jgi:GNAT superfamily N-acetyltransferase